jgi:hydroxyacylglutathione hydrolase
VFVGDVGRPDLLERAAGQAGTMETGARQLYQSLRRFERLPDYVQVWPAHGAGSACGKSLGAVPQSTVGYEKLFNWAFGHHDEESFVRAVLEGQPEPPRYFAEMKRVNRDGPPVLGELAAPPRRPAAALDTTLRAGGLVIDVRGAAAYARGHVPGTISIPLTRSFSTWAGWLVPYDRDFFLLVDDESCDGCLAEAVRHLSFVGLDHVAGWFGADALRAWTGRGGALETIAEVTPDELAERMAADDVVVLDVRGRGEWEAGHLPGVRPAGETNRIHIPLGNLTERLAELPRDRPVVVHCLSGTRSAIGASLLQAHGFADVAHLQGGFARWTREGHPTEKEEGASDFDPPHVFPLAPPALDPAGRAGRASRVPPRRTS